MGIAAPAQACFDAITDFESYPAWQSAVKKCRVHERDEEGRGQIVETVSDARIRTIRYVLRYHYEPPRRVWWDYVEGDVDSVAGDYVFDEREGVTVATYSLEVDPGFFVPGALRDRAARHIMRTSVRELRDRVERR
jgi:ribosome-associated toxin RatA of RatAB toxin-antitoxin module